MSTKTFLDEQQQALESARSGYNIFITGAAGTGKSYLLKNIIEQLNYQNKNIQYIAPTGMVACDGGGSTIHGLFGLPLGVSNIEILVSYGIKQKHILSQIDTLILDEVSMIPVYIFEVMDKILRLCTGHHQLPFGGKQVICCGDYHQLEPVIEKGFMIRTLVDRYGGVYAFNSSAWKCCDFKTIELRYSHRHVDVELHRILTAMRNGTLTQDDLNYVNQKCCMPSHQIPVSSTYLCSTNERVAEYNAHMVSKLTGRSVISYAMMQGQFNKSSCMPDDVLTLIEGGEVMLLKNKMIDHDRYLYVNGALGVIERILNDGSVEVRLRSHGGIVTVKREVWKQYQNNVMSVDADGHIDKIERVEIGRYEQMPLTYAYALTVNKAQGLTLDRVHIDLMDGARMPGNRLYVAMSRVRRLCDLTYDRPLTLSDVQMNQNIIEFYNNLRFNIR